MQNASLDDALTDTLHTYACMHDKNRYQAVPPSWIRAFIQDHSWFINAFVPLYTYFQLPVMDHRPCVFELPVALCPRLRFLRGRFPFTFVRGAFVGRGPLAMFSLLGRTIDAA